MVKWLVPFVILGLGIFLVKRASVGDDPMMLKKAREDMERIAKRIIGSSNMTYCIPTTEQGLESVDNLIKIRGTMSIERYKQVNAPCDLRDGPNYPTFKDPWGTPYEYSSAGVSVNFTIKSYGSDLQPGTSKKFGVTYGQDIFYQYP